MKIAFIGQKGVPASIGGVETHVEELATRLANSGHEIFVYNRPNYANAETKRYNGINILTLATIPTKHFDAISHAFRAIIDASRRDYDLVHFHSIGPSFLIWLFKLLNPGVPVVATFHSRDYFHQKWNRLAKLFLKAGEFVLCKYADRVISVSKGIKVYVEKKYKISAYYLPNGIGEVRKTQANKIKVWGLEKDNYILAVSRLIPHKGIHYLIEAYKKLNTDKKLVIVGEGFFTDKYTQQLEKISKDNKNIIFTGKQNKEALEEFYSNAYAFVQPSEYEGLSVVLIEAMSHSLPIIISDISENTDVVLNTAYTFKNKDINDLAIKLKFVLENSEIVKEKGQEAGLLALKDFSWENITLATEKLYMNLLADKEYKKKSWSKRLVSKFLHLFI